MLGKQIWKRTYNKIFQGEGQTVRVIWLRNGEVTVIYAIQGRLLEGCCNLS